MNNGDAQQWNEILKALKEVFPNAVEGGCRWHIGKLILHLSFVFIAFEYI